MTFVADRQRLHEAGRLPVLGHHGQAGSDALADVAAAAGRRRPARRVPVAVRVHAHHRLEQLGAARAHQAVQPDHFAAPHRERHARRAPCAPVWPAGCSACHVEHDAARRPPDASDRPGAAPPPVMRWTIQATSTSARRRRADDPAVAQHGDLVGDGQQLLEPVRDVDDRHAVTCEIADHLEEDRDLGAGQRRGRLVHQQDADVVNERARDLDDLLLPERQRAHAGPRRDRRVARAARASGARRPPARRHATVPQRVRRSRPTKRFSATVRSGKSCSSWWIIPMPRAAASRVEANRTSVPVDQAGAPRSAARCRRGS